jgi:hypothetical protein
MLRNLGGVFHFGNGNRTGLRVSVSGWSSKFCKRDFLTRWRGRNVGGGCHRHRSDGECQAGCGDFGQVVCVLHRRRSRAACLHGRLDGRFDGRRYRRFDGRLDKRLDWRLDSCRGGCRGGRCSGRCSGRLGRHWDAHFRENSREKFSGRVNWRVNRLLGKCLDWRVNGILKGRLELQLWLRNWLRQHFVICVRQPRGGRLGWGRLG